MQTSGRTVRHIPNAKFGIDGSTEEDRVRLRSEAEAPFRSLRLTLFGFSVVSSGLGALISVPQLLGALAGGRNALPLEEAGLNVAINMGALVVFGLLLRSDLQARDKQMARLTREEKLGALSVQLANGKVLPVSALRGSARIVIAAGTRAQVKSALEAAAPFKQELIRRGVLVLPLPIYGGEGEDEAVELPSPSKEELRWVATPIRLEGWRDWFEAQLKFASKAKTENGLFVGLRLDGRVRASGQGCPPWARFAAELAPLEGDDKWTGFFDGFDGRIG
eukprot:CAMPEP_0202919384 /NCGR_PEP_ID=MMETSP1392-20130828/75718_1 /ASSEMBLY_ACC=CAM_ASM_000868 /TAXON_ID=225041 /ORGANISM="Chlamydomonas chlamydogama, Strain SAG 11-48b" /LENGTH=277 /DNA_ID=CAMNT_0049612727 /DNA_START=146 /DNA_END=979 /DNA_ORIENTATION=-